MYEIPDVTIPRLSFYTLSIEKGSVVITKPLVLRMSLCARKASWLYYMVLPCLFGNLLCCYQLYSFVNTRKSCGFVKAITKGFIILFWECIWIRKVFFLPTIMWCQWFKMIEIQCKNQSAWLEIATFPYSRIWNFSTVLTKNSFPGRNF